MSTPEVGQTLAVANTRRNSWLIDRCRRLMLQRLEGLRDGALQVREATHSVTIGERGAGDAVLIIHDADAWAEMVLGGSIGAAEAFMAGKWSSPDLLALIRLFARNLHLVDTLEGGLARFTEPLRKLLHSWHRNTRGQARANIAAHYDLGNDFFRLWLDPSMMYSSAIYPQASAGLDTAATYKLQQIGEKLALTPADHLLEIGTGWGGLAIYMAQNFGCRVTTTTISERQYDEARARVQALGLQDRITLLKQDYRDLDGQYDKLVSVEMIEAVGLEYLPTYFRQCARLLKPDGAFLLQAITIADQRYAQAARSVDFIQRYIFPGGALPSVTRMLECMRDESDFRLADHHEIGLHYAQTLADWRQRFHARLADVRAQGYDERFIRMWEYYLVYCEAGFREHSIGCTQMLFHKPGYRSGELPKRDRSLRASVPSSVPATPAFAAEQH